MLELKSCPHCNGNGRIVSVSGFKSDRYRAVCEQCGASTRECETEQEAVSAWNMRADGWIDVRMLLPIDQEEVLVCTLSKSGIRNIDKGYWAIDRFRAIDRLIHRGRVLVTHWRQPLPEPPKGEQE